MVPEPLGKPAPSSVVSGERGDAGLPNGQPLGDPAAIPGCGPQDRQAGSPNGHVADGPEYRYMTRRRIRRFISLDRHASTSST